MANSHDIVARNWARQTGKATRGFNVFYDGPTIYSYGRHYAIARLVYVNGKRVALVNSRGYSVSTAKHTGHVWRALDYGRALQCFSVPFVTSDSVEAHAVNVADLRARASHCRDKAKRARLHGAGWLEQAAKLDEQATLYAATFLATTDLPVAA